MDPDSLAEVLEADRESDAIEFKEFANLQAKGERKRETLELIKDVTAIANSGGGAIAVGLNDWGEPTGDASGVLDSDVSELPKLVEKYTGVSPFVKLHVRPKGGKRLAVIEIGGVDVPMVFGKRGAYTDGKGGQGTAFGDGTIYFRRGARSVPGTTADVLRAVDRYREKWIADILNVAKAPPGSTIEIRDPRSPRHDDAKVSPVRPTNDPAAPEVRYPDPDETHPYQTMEMVALLEKRLPGWRITVPLLCAIRAVYQLDSRRYLTQKPRNAPRRYSETFADWVVDQVSRDRHFFLRVRTQYRRQRH